MKVMPLPITADTCGLNLVPPLQWRKTRPFALNQRHSLKDAPKSHRRFPHLKPAQCLEVYYKR